MSNFLGSTPCAALDAGHRTLPPSHQRGSRKAEPQGVSGISLERRSAPRGNSWRRPGDGGGGVGTPVGSRGASPSLLSSRASWCSYHREALTHTSAPGTALPVPERRPSPHRPAGGDTGPGRRRFAGGGMEPRSAREVPHREATRGGGPMTGPAGAGTAGRTRWVSSPPHPRVPWCSYHQVASQNSDRPPACRWEIGAGQEQGSTPRGNSRRRPGDGVGGVGAPVWSRWASPFPPQAEGPFRSSYLLKGPSPFSG